MLIKTERIERKKQKKKIKRILEEIFIDIHAGEYTKTSYSKTFIEAKVHKDFPSASWRDDIYPILLSGRKKLYNSYNGVDGYAKFINVDILDEREECERKYEKLIKEMCENNELPVFLDRDNSEYRIIYNLNIFEQVFGDILVSEVKTVKKRISMMAKTGAKLPSGKDSRDLIRDTLKPLREIEYKETKMKSVNKCNNKSFGVCPFKVKGFCHSKELVNTIFCLCSPEKMKELIKDFKKDRKTEGS